MSRVKGKGNRSTEQRLVRLLRADHLSGWRRHLPLPGTPDFAWPKAKVAVFVDGCFWHGHNTCKRNITPKQNAKFWQEKIERNRRRDRRQARELRAKGWKVLRIWECDLKKRPEQCVRRIRRAVAERQESSCS